MGNWFLKFKQLSIRKKLLILIVILTVLGLIFIITTRRREIPPEEALKVTKPLPPGGLTSSGFRELAEQKETPGGKLFEKGRLIIDDEVSFSTLSLDKERHYYFSRAEEGIMESSLEGRDIEEIFKSRFECINDILWSFQKDKVILSTDQGFYFLDLKTNQISPLSGNITNIIWSSDGTKIAYQYLDRLAGYNNISISNPDGSDWYKLINVKSEGPSSQVVLSIWSPDSNYLYFTSESFDVSGGNFKRVNLDTGQIEDLSDWENVAGILYSPDGSKILYVTLDYNEKYQIVPNVRVMKADSTDKKDTGIDAYLHKCIWKKDSKTIICALSEDINNMTSNDILIELDLETGQKKQLTAIEEGQPINVKDLILSQDEKTLFFKNNIDGKLYSLEI